MTPTELGQRLGIEDVFVLRRVSDNQLISLSGAGRGEGWAGNISIDTGREPLITASLGSPGVHRYSGETQRIFGPYWNSDAAATRVGDFVVVYGGNAIVDLSDEALIDAAGTLAWAEAEVPAEKRLADELEVTQVALQVASLKLRAVDEFLTELAAVAMDALSCEFGAVVIPGDPDRVVVAPMSTSRDVDATSIVEAVRPIVARSSDGAPVVDQDIAGSALADCLPEVLSCCVIPIGQSPRRAAVVVGHTVETPRGFTTLCQAVARRMGEQATQTLASETDDEIVLSSG